MFFEMGSSNLITEDQHIVKQKNLLCRHPSYTYTGSGWFDDLDAKAGMQTSDSLFIISMIMLSQLSLGSQPIMIISTTTKLSTKQVRHLGLVRNLIYEE
jgi:hypothetical protein